MRYWKMNIIGEFFGTSGYANHTRSLANELNKLIPCKILTNLPIGWERDVNDQELEMIKREEDYEINLIITNPLYWRVHCNAKRNIVYLIWEGDKIPAWMVNECMNPKINKIIVPSQHTYNALKKGFEDYDPDAWLGVGDEAGCNKVVKIPHGVDLETFYPIVSDKKDETLPNSHLETRSKLEEENTDGKTRDVDNHADFKFLANKGLRNLEDRGGIQYLIKAYLEEFKPEEKVELILKINPAYGIPNLLTMFPEIKGKIPKITFIPENYTKKQLNELYNSVDVFVSPTRAEAFNLPCLEAMACGKPVITTNYGGQIDYCTNETGWLIDYKLAPVTFEIEYESCSWATPKIEELKRALRFTFENREIVKQKGKCAVEVAKNLTWSKTAEKVKNLVQPKDI